MKEEGVGHFKCRGSRNLRIVGAEVDEWQLSITAAYIRDLN